MIALSSSSALAQTLTPLHTFCPPNDCNDGAYPSSDLTFAGGGFYGTTRQGGMNNSGTLYHLAPDGTLRTVFSFCNLATCPDGETPVGGVTLGSNGVLYGATQQGGGPFCSGIVYSSTGAAAQILAAFCSPTHDNQYPLGAQPQSAPILASDGNLYGTTTRGGTDPTGLGFGGTVYKISGGVLSTLYNFCSVARGGVCADGDQPYGGLVEGIDGDLYGTTAAGGAGGGTVYKLTKSGLLTTLYNFCAVGSCPDGIQPLGRLVQDSQGNLYGTTSGNASYSGTVFKITPQGTLTTLIDFGLGPITQGSRPYFGRLLLGVDGFLYGTTWMGGQGGHGTVFRISVSGALTTLYQFCQLTSCADGSGPEWGLAQDSMGNLFGSTDSGGVDSTGFQPNHGIVFRLTLPAVDAGMPDAAADASADAAADASSDAGADAAADAAADAGVRDAVAADAVAADAVAADATSDAGPPGDSGNAGDAGGSDATVPDAQSRGVDAAPSRDASPSPDAGAAPKGSGGCGCSVARDKGAGHPREAAFALLLVGLFCLSRRALAPRARG